MKSGRPIRTQLFLLVAIVALPLLGLIAFNLYRNFIADREVAGRAASALAAITAADTARFLDDAQKVLVSLSHRPLVRALDPRFCDPLLEGYLDGHPQFANVITVNTSAEVVCSALPIQSGAVAVPRHVWLDRLIQTEKFTIGSPARGTITGRSVVVLAYPLRDQAGKLIGAIGLPTDLASFRLAAANAKLSPDADVAIVTGDGTVVASLRDAGTLVGTDMRGAEIAAIVLAQKQGVARARGLSGTDRIYGFQPVPGADWYVLAGIPVSAMFADIYGGAWQSAIAASLAVFLALVLALVLARAVSRPLRAAVATARRIREGDRDARFQPAGPTEIAEVAAEFNRSLDALAEDEHRRRETEGRFSEVMGAVAEGIISIDEQQRIVIFNAGAERMFGRSAAAMIGQPLDLLVPERFRAGHGGYVGRFAGTGQTNRPMGKYGSICGLRASGQEFRIEAAVSRSGESPNRLLTVILRDITERVRAEENLRRLARARGVMAECNRVLIHASDEAQMLADMCRVVVELGGFRLAWIGFAERDEAKSVRPVAWAGPDTDYLAAIQVSWGDNEHGQGTSGTAIRTGKPSVASDSLADPRLAPWRERVAQYGFRSVIALPLSLGTECIGALNIYAAEVNAFDDAEVALLQELADDIAYGLAALRSSAERKAAELALVQSEELFRQLVRNIPEIFWVQDVASDQILYVSPTWQAIAGRLPPKDLQDILEIVQPEDYRRVAMAASKARGGGVDHEYRILRPDGSTRWLHVRTFPIRNAAGDVYRVAGVAQDITGQKAAAARLLRVAHYDALTNLPNRTLFNASLQRSLDQAEQNQWIVGVLFIDLDRFKVVIDTLGHASGDVLLQQVALRLVECARIRDVVGRLGGDEFGLILPALESAAAAGALARRILQAFSAPFELEGREVFITTSIGITIYPLDAVDPGTLLRYADTAMYRAKDDGRGIYRYYKAEMNAQATERLDLENDLRRALERREFVLHYQPKLDLKTGEICGVEALLRWLHPGRGLLPPADFIALLEETGLIVPVGQWVIGEVCRQLNAWEQEGTAPVPVAVNLSPRQFHDKGLFRRIIQAMQEYGTPPGLLEFEITESALMSHAEDTVLALTEMQTAGIRIAIDDFGTGYSSLSYLKRFAINVIKIDSSFVRDIMSDPDDAAITLAIIGMAHQLGLKVVAEGVETLEQLNFLRANGCDEIQGFHFSRPVSAADFAERLREHRENGPSPPGR